MAASLVFSVHERCSSGGHPDVKFIIMVYAQTIGTRKQTGIFVMLGSIKISS